MSKLNSTKRTTAVVDDSKLMVGEIAGMRTNAAAKQTPYMQLRLCVLANLLWEKNAYIDGESVTNKISELIPLCNAQDVANLAVEARKIQKLRHTPLYIVSEMLKNDDMRPLVKDVLPVICTRADMITDMLAIYWKDGKKPLPNALKIGLAKSFYNFNEYQFAKYDRNAPIKLRDVMFMCHPKPRNAKERELFNKIAGRTLEIPETWETMLSSGKDKKETWEYLITSNKIGNLAMLRNVRNMMNADVDKSIIKQGIKNMNSSMILPLDFMKANRLTNNVFERELEDKMLNSYKDISKLPGKSLLVIDVSGSMAASISYGSIFTRYDVAAALITLASFKCEDYDIVLTAGNDSTCVEKHIVDKYAPIGFDLGNYLNSSTNKVGYGGIFTAQCINSLKNELKDKYERIIVFSDSQDVDVAHGSKVKPQVFGKYNYIVNVGSHTNSIAYNGIWDAEIAGWSEHFLDYIAAYEELSESSK